MLPSSVIKRLLLCRYFLSLAVDQSRSHREVASFATINLTQDSVEFFLLAAVEHRNIRLSNNAPFNQIFDSVDASISPKTLPFRQRLMEMNRVRVNSKHHGIQPNPNDLEPYITVVREFLQEATLTVFGVDLHNISLVSQLNEGTVKDLLSEAESAFQNRNFLECLVLCRKAFYLTFEKDYDAALFVQEEVPLGILAIGSKVPYFARNKEYIENKVRNHFDYIILDFSALDNELLQDGIDTVTFWNIRRVTPDVYQTKDGNWLVRDEFAKTEGDLENNAAYVFENTIDIILRRQSRLKAAKFVGPGSKYVVPLARAEVPIYTKADRTSKIDQITPPNLRYLHVNGSVPGLKNVDERYWVVSHWEKNGPMIIGYVHDDDVDLTLGVPTDAS